MPWSNINLMIIVNMQMDHPRICVNHTIISIKIRNTALIFDHFPLDPKHPQTALLHRLLKEQLNETPKKRHTRKYGHGEVKSITRNLPLERWPHAKFTTKQPADSTLIA